MLVGNDKIVSIRFNMYDSEGNLLEERMQQDPVIYLHGGNAILPVLQQQLTGMNTGETKRVVLPAIDGIPGAGYYFDVVIDDIRDALAEEIMLGYALPVYKEEDCGIDCGCYKLLSK